MKTLKNTFKIIAGVFLLATISVSCIPEQQSIGDAGQTLIKFLPGDYTLLALDAVTASQKGVLFEVRKDVHNAASLNTPTQVTLTYDAAGDMLNWFNAENGTHYIPLPGSLGTTTPAISSNKIVLDFAPGDYVKSVELTVPNATLFDFSKNYALAFAISTITGSGIKSEATFDTIVAEVLVKNRFDGKYEVTGTFQDFITPSWTGAYPKNVNLETSGALSVRKYDTDYGVYGYIFTVDPTTVSQFGNWTPAFNFDASNNVISVVNTTTDAAPRSRTAVLYTGPDAMENKWDPATKTLKVSYQLRQETTNPQLRNVIHETYIFKGPR